MKILVIFKYLYLFLLLIKDFIKKNKLVKSKGVNKQKLNTAHMIHSDFINV